MRNKGFTLIEVIIVIVILGILAGLALPRIARQAEAARAAEALNMIGALKRAAIDCVDSTGATTFGGCSTVATLGVSVPGGAAFTYKTGGTTTGTMIFCAQRSSNYIGLQLGLGVDTNNNPIITTTYQLSPNNATNPYYATITRAAGGAANVVALGTCATNL